MVINPRLQSKMHRANLVKVEAELRLQKSLRHDATKAMEE